MLLSNSQLNLTTIWMLLCVAFHCLPWATGSHHHAYSLRDLLSSLWSIIPASLMGSPLDLLESWYPLTLGSLLSSVYTAQRCAQWGPSTSEHVVQMIGHEKSYWINILTPIQMWPEINFYKDSDLCWFMVSSTLSSAQSRDSVPVLWMDWWGPEALHHIIITERVWHVCQSEDEELKMPHEQDYSTSMLYITSLPHSQREALLFLFKFNSNVPWKFTDDFRAQVKKKNIQLESLR